MYKQIQTCRVCGNDNLACVLDLGEKMLTGVFPREKDAKITSGPLRLVKCHGSDEACGLLQLEHTYELSELYGKNYGYRSGLNVSMVTHLHSKVEQILNRIKLKDGDLIVDIGSNDSTTLQAYPPGLTLVGIDPTGVKFHVYYPKQIELIPEFFSSQLLTERFPEKKAKVITSIAMFYDLEDPLDFMAQIHRVLADDGIWVFEQSYMPTMLEMNAYDTVCHEHLEYYGLQQIKWMTDRVGFKILDVEFNDVNGGSFSVTVSKSYADGAVSPVVQNILDHERDMKLDCLDPYLAFAQRTAQSRVNLQAFIDSANEKEQTVAALGASTKGNVLLQYCNFTEKDIFAVGEVNADKFGCFMPGTWIPIIPEEALLEKHPDYMIVLPWHFRKFFVNNPKFAGMSLVFPLPKLEIL